MMNGYNYIVCCFVIVNMVAMCSAVCPNDCYRCDQTSSYCETCNTGYYLSSNTCYQCSDNCLSCSDNGKFQCTGCKIGYFLKANLCIRCSNNCTSCEHENKCFTCEKDFYPVTSGGGNNDCLRCGGSKLPECNSCTDGLFGTDCTRDCSFCRDSVCLKTNCAYGCIDGYYENTSGGDIFCSPCNQGCLLCDSHSVCTLCEHGKYLVPNNGTCIDCRSNCDSCVDYNNCGTCVKGTWGTDCGQICSLTCIGNTCNKDTGICNEGCISGYYENAENKCTPCLDSVVQCQDLNCPNRTYLFDNTCIQCPSNCKNKTCEPINGNCTYGCIKGRRGHQCMSRCFGSCEACERLTGICTLCPKRSYGNSCNETCSNQCVNSNCDITGKCIDGCIIGYEGDSCDQEQDLNEQGNKDKSTENETNEQPIGVIAGAAGGGAVFVIMVICVVVIFCVRRRKSKSETETHATFSVASTTDANTEQGYIYAVPYKMMKTNTLQINTNSPRTADSPPIPLRLSYLEDQETDVDDIQVEEEIDDEEPENSVIVNEVKIDPAGDTYYNVAGLKRSRVSIDSLREYVAKKTETEFDKEFQNFPKGLTRPFTESRKPENITHNRYRAIYPYDATRVVLHDGKPDYINASYIDGHNQPKAYIASLGPTKVTMDTFTLFWRMVWQEKVEKIVMLTNLVEGEKMKCEQYWPDVRNSTHYGDIVVACDVEDVCADFCVKRFTISKDDEKRVLHHFHFTAWPDRSVPGDVTCLIEFRQKVEMINTNLGGPLVVHCSAGVGRTGTYIGLDMLAKEGKIEGSVDIFGCVMGMRGQRVSMVQTLEQYQYLHEAVVHVLTMDSEAIS